LPIDAPTFRRIMGCFATGVGVVTTDNDGRLHGLTANSITSVSLDPMLLLVCVDKAAHGHAELRRCRSFGISILASDQRDISNLFAKTGEPELGSLRGVPYRRGESGCPLVDGAIAHFECLPHAELDAGDHTIFVGRVLHGEAGRQDVGPLLYFRGGYREIGAG
jgi:flavin reductase (DIM6/NTAB) family NADH-FMN oxidoreductase RutF